MRGPYNQDIEPENYTEWRESDMQHAIRLATWHSTSLDGLHLHQLTGDGDDAGIDPRRLRDFINS